VKPNCFGKFWAVAALACASPSASAFDTASIEFGSGSNVQLLRLGVQSRWESQWWRSNGTHVGGYWDATIAHWRGSRFRGVRDGTQSITAIGITPVFRLQQDSGRGLYAEAGIGLHLLSDLYDNAGKQLSTRLQFGDHLAIGYVFRNDLDLKLKIQHFSNGRLKKPNDGINFAILSASYQF
jgi:lipid A 3-O-deacylase